nr:MAG TPA: hypothetical protein [Caudoviricetes sp.]
MGLPLLRSAFPYFWHKFKGCSRLETVTHAGNRWF